MPFTFFGIGTKYLGKKNFELRAGMCQKCNKLNYLKSYEADLYVVLLYIPIVPLGSKIILDHCANCSNHKIMPLEEWSRLKGAADLKGSEVENKITPDDPKTAIEKLENFYVMGQRLEAIEMTANMKIKFANNAEAQIYLGGYYESLGNIEEADACFERALSVEPDNKEARRAVAIGCIHKNDLKRAQSLLSFMECKCPEQDPDTLFVLASALQKNGNYREAYSYYQIVARDFPQFAREDKEFKRNVRKTEKILDEDYSILPGKKSSP